MLRAGPIAEVGIVTATFGVTAPVQGEMAGSLLSRTDQEHSPRSRRVGFRLHDL
jgi:hypothetical protein